MEFDNRLQQWTAVVLSASYPDTLDAGTPNKSNSMQLLRHTQMLFLGQLTMLESAKLTERLTKFVMLKMVFLGAVTGSSRVEIVMWFTWRVPKPVRPRPWIHLSAPRTNCQTRFYGIRIRPRNPGRGCGQIHT